jgi:hypothetical protein
VRVAPLGASTLVAALLALGTPGDAAAQTREGVRVQSLPGTIRPTAPPRVPFQPGERLTYKVKLGVFTVGEGHMTVHGVEDVRGSPSYHVSMDLDGSAMFGTVKVRDRFHSWIDVRTLASRRFVRDIHEVKYKSYRAFEIYPEERRWERSDEYDDQDGETLSDLPLDEIAFMYFIRTIPLEVGETYTFDRYFKEDGNPVVVKVLRREEKEVDAGRFNTIVVQPIIKTSGLFSEGGKAELYFTDDEERRLIYMRSEIPIVGSITLHLKEVDAHFRPSRGAEGR